jgi:hypothetical protein
MIQYWDISKNENGLRVMLRGIICKIKRKLPNKITISYLYFALNLICVSDKQSQPIWRDDSKNKDQVGSRETYTIGYTKFGNLFGAACFADEEQITIVP